MDITVCRIMGGMIEFEKTGVYPDYLYFTSESLNHTWKQKIKNDYKKGSIKLGGKKLCNFIYENNQCRVQEPGGEWMDIESGLMLCD